jgi:hypothetical protein
MRTGPTTAMASRQKAAPFIDDPTRRATKGKNARPQIPGVGVIASGPIVTAISGIRQEIAGVKLWSPNSEVATALELACAKLDRALSEAQRTDIWLTVKDVAEMTHRPRSTITLRCREHGENVGAHKWKGVWSIHWPTFEEFLRRGTPKPKEAA